MNSELYIPLRSILVGVKKMRYVTLDDADTIVKNGEMMSQVPLFLATDILNGTSVTPDNQPRIHARYGKQGLATKLLFPAGTKVSGLHGVGKGVWFYTVAGAMKVTFEFHSPQHQVAMMDSLEHVWRIKCRDPPVPHSRTIQGIRQVYPASIDKNSNDSEENGTNFSGQSQELSKEGQTDTRFEKSRVQGGAQSGELPTQKRSYTIVLDDSAPKKKRTLDDFRKDELLVTFESNQEASLTKQDVSISKFPVHHVEEVSTDEEAVHHSPSKLLSDKCWCQSIDRVFSAKGDSFVLSSLNESIKRLCEVVHQMTTIELKTLVDLLSAVSQSFLIPSSSVLSRTENLSDDDKGRSGNRVLGAVARLLGSKFNAEVSAINERVEEFKLKNIDQITNLPQPESLVHNLFPKPMVDFVTCWMGSNNDGEVTNSSSGAISNIGNDCSNVSGASEAELQIKGVRTCDAKDSSASTCFPLVQFILELANQTLISGMAHVIYPRLVQNGNTCM